MGAVRPPVVVRLHLVARAAAHSAVVRAVAAVLLLVVLVLWLMVAAVWPRWRVALRPSAKLYSPVSSPRLFTRSLPSL